MIKVLIADDQALIRESLQALLLRYSDIELVDTVGDGEAVLDVLAHHRVDIVLIDAALPKLDGLTCAKYINEHYTETRVIVLTSDESEEAIFTALQNGVSAYLLKDIHIEDLHRAIHTVYDGGAVAPPRVTATIFRLFQQLAQSDFTHIAAGEQAADLTQMEWRIAQQVGSGYSNKEIAEYLFLSEGTIRNYLSILLSKLHLRDRTQLAIWAVQSGIVKRTFHDRGTS